MKVKKEYIVLAALIVAPSVYLLMHNRDRTQYDLPVLQKVPAAEITKMEIRKPDGTTITLEKTGEDWVILPGDYRAEAGKISVMLKSMSDLTLTALVSETESYERYGLSEEERLGVRAWAGAELKRDFEVGKTAASFQHTFVRMAGDARVFHAAENLKSRFDQTVDTLHDKTVLRVDPSAVQSLEIQGGGKTRILTRKPISVEVGRSKEEEPPGRAQEVWESPEGEVDGSKVTKILDVLANLKCRAYLYDNQKGDFEKPLYTLTLKGLETHELSFFHKDEKNQNDYPATSSQNPSPFLIPEHQAKQVMLPPEEILK